ncbi:MAG TPA: hypothetical protein VGH99_17685 [Pseudonocardia sp.]
MRTPSAVLLALCCAAGLLGGCAPAAPAAPPPAAPRPSYPLPPRPVRPGEKPLVTATGQQGDTRFTLIGLSSLSEIIGSHAEWEPKGRFVRVRLVVENVGRSGVDFDTKAQQLVTADGLAHDVDPQAMLIKRQPGEFALGAAVRLEFDLYYDVPVGAVPVALRVRGGDTLAGTSDPEHVDVPLR